MRKITVTLPNKKSPLFKMRYGAGGGITKRKDPVSIFRRMEKRIISLPRAKKTSVVIKDGVSVINESLTSSNKKYLLWLSLCFLEDNLPKRYYDSKEKLYAGSEP